MKLPNKWAIRGLAVGLAATCLLGGVALAAAGDKSDPFITLSYLTQTILPQLLEDVEDETQDLREDMTDDFDDKISDYQDEMESLLLDVSDNLGSQAQTENYVYSVVTLTQGQTLSMNVGCEVMLRIGSATVAGENGVALIDTSSASELYSGGSLVTNHLYLCTIDGRTLTATAGTTKVLVRGDYSL